MYVKQKFPKNKPRLALRPWEIVAPELQRALDDLYETAVGSTENALYLENLVLGQPVDPSPPDWSTNSGGGFRRMFLLMGA